MHLHACIKKGQRNTSSAWNLIGTYMQGGPGLNISEVMVLVFTLEFIPKPKTILIFSEELKCRRDNIPF